MTPNDTIYNNSVLKLYFRYNNIIFYEIIQLKWWCKGLKILWRSYNALLPVFFSFYLIKKVNHFDNKLNIEALKELGQFKFNLDFFSTRRRQICAHPIKSSIFPTFYFFPFARK